MQNGQLGSSTPKKNMEMKINHLKFIIKEIPLQKGRYSDELYIA